MRWQQQREEIREPFSSGFAGKILPSARAYETNRYVDKFVAQLTKPVLCGPRVAVAFRVEIASRVFNAKFRRVRERRKERTSCRGSTEEALGCRRARRNFTVFT